MTMTQRKVRTPRATISPAMAGRLPSAGYRQPRGAESVILPMMVWLTLIALAFCFQVIIMAFTPLTYLLDEVKILLFFIMGPALMLFVVGAYAFRQAPLPSRPVAYGLLGYFGVIVLSTLFAHYRWIGYFYIVFAWASSGFFMAAFVVGATRKGSYHFIRYLVLMLLGELLIGFFLYDMLGDAHHHSGISYLMALIYGPIQPENPSTIYTLMQTLVGADDTLQSTILNREFFSDFCCLFVPFALLLGIAPGPSSRPQLWRWIGLVTAVIGYAAIFLCQSKGEWVFATVAVLFMLGMLLKIGYFKLRHLLRGHTLAWLTGSVILLGALGWMKSPLLISRLKTAGTSYESRYIIWSGAWQIFKENLHNMIIGGGPGTFRIYFSGHRRPDYYLHAINNVTTFSHNYLLDVLSETGMIGLAVFLFLIGALFFLGVRQALRKQNDIYLRLMLIAALAGFLGFFGSNLTSPSGRWVIGATPMWTVMGLLAGLIYQGEKGPFRIGAAAPAAPAGTAAPAGAAAHAVPAVPAAGATPHGATGEAPEALHPGVSIATPPFVVVLFLASCLMFGWGVVSGFKYFDGNRDYATGLSYMELGSRMWEQFTQSPQNSANIDNIVAYLKESIKDFNKATDLDPTNTSAYYKIGSSYTTLSQIYQMMASNAASRGKMDEARALTDESDRNLQLAKDKYETLINVYDPDYAEIHYNMGIIYQLWAEYLQRGIANHAVGQDFAPQMVTEYENLSLKHLDQMGQGSYKPEGALRLGSTYRRLRLFDKARDVFRAASHRSSADKEMFQEYFDAAIDAKDPASACDAAERLWLIQPQNDVPLDRLVQLAKQNHFDDVEQRVIARLEHINPVHPRLYELKIDLAQRGGKPEELLTAVENYIKCDGQELELFLLGAQTAEKLGRAGEAREIYSRIVKIDRDVRTPSGQAARAWLSRGAAAPGAAAATPRPAPAAAATSASQSGSPSGKPAAPAR